MLEPARSSAEMCRNTSLPPVSGWMTAVDPLVGREGDLSRLLEALGRSRLVTLTGPGGSGKTRLARAMLASLAESGRPARFVDCAAIEQPALVWPAMAAALGIEEPGEGDPPRGVIEALTQPLRPSP